jgi:hypothetical protein
MPKNRLAEILVDLFKFGQIHTVGLNPILQSKKVLCLECHAAGIRHEILCIKIGLYYDFQVNLCLLLIHQALNISCMFYMTGLTTEEIQQCFWRGIQFIFLFCFICLQL